MCGTVSAAAPMLGGSVDFVVVGFGIGALGVLLGVLLRGWLTGRGEQAALRAADPAVAAYERANAAECRGAGQAFLAAGAAVVLATVGGLAGGLDDRSGALLVTTTATVAALGIIVWGYLYRSRHPMPPRPRRPAPVATSSGPMAAPGLTPPAPNARLAADDPLLAPAAAAEPALDAEEPPPDAFPNPPHSPEPDDAAEDADSASAEAPLQDAAAAANGHPGASAPPHEGKIVAFVGRAAPAQAGDGLAARDDDASDD